jgi:hypothetical protein
MEFEDKGRGDEDGQIYGRNLTICIFYLILTGTSHSWDGIKMDRSHIALLQNMVQY